MPIYEYLCAACGQRFEKLQKSSSTEIPPCPACGMSQVTRQFSTFAAATSSTSPAAACPSAPSGGCPGGG